MQVTLLSRRPVRWVAPALYVAALSGHMWLEGVPIGRERLLLWRVLGLLALSLANLGGWMRSGRLDRAQGRGPAGRSSGNNRGQAGVLLGVKTSCALSVGSPRTLRRARRYAVARSALPCVLPCP